MKVYVVIGAIGGVVDDVEVYLDTIKADEAEKKFRKEYRAPKGGDSDNDVYQFSCEVVE